MFGSLFFAICGGNRVGGLLMERDLGREECGI